MTTPSKNSPRYSPEREEQGFFSSSLFKVMIAVLFVAGIAVAGVYYYNTNKATEPDGEEGTEGQASEDTPIVGATETFEEPVDEPVNEIIETRTTYEYAEAGNTYTLLDEGGPGPWEFTCGIAAVQTSSVLASQGKASYASDNMTDTNEATTWAEGTAGLGVGEWIKFTLTDVYKKWGYNEDFITNNIRGEFIIQAGYAKSPSAWKGNGRPAKLKCYLNGEPLSIIQLQNTPNVQSFGIFPNEAARVDLKEGDVILFEIMDVVQGVKDEDTCISEFHIVANCG